MEKLYSITDLQNAIGAFVVSTHPGKSVKRSFNYSRDTLRQNLVDFIASLPSTPPPADVVDNAVALDVEKMAEAYWKDNCLSAIGGLGLVSHYMTKEDFLAFAKTIAGFAAASTHTP